MEQTSSASAEKLFLAVIERPASERAGFLESACGDDSALRAEVELLVACHDVAGDFLEHAPASSSFIVDDIDLSRTPDRIGKFAIKRLLGAGGMGCVYLAESSDPQRLVALKVIRPGWGTAELMRRFRHEVRVVAVLQHPAIAQLYEAGAETTPVGPLPWFAMEYVRGRSITEDARERGLTWRDRLRLMAQVSAGVHHAHQRGVIHRDLKPGNILVDDTGRPRILDFGVARLMKESEEAGATARTATGQLVGTLAYMSPEQVSGDPRLVDVRSDIYALGVVLYELLAGVPPYDISRLGLAEAARVIRETTPRRLGEIDRHLRGDVEAVVEMAMAKEPERRYQSAQEFVADIERVLADQAVMARRASTGYYLIKFTKRHRVLVGMSAVVIASVLAGLGASLWQARVAERERSRAVKSLEVSTAINAFMDSLFASADPNNAKKPDMMVREVLERSTVEELQKKFPDQPEVRAAVHGAIGRTYKSLSLFKEAEPHLIEAERLSLETGADEKQRFSSVRDLGHLYKMQDRFEEAEPRLLAATEAAQTVFGHDDEVTISCRNDLASLLLRRGDASGAEKLYRESVEGAARSLSEANPIALASLNNWGASLRATGQPEKAIEVRRRLLALCRKHMGEDDVGTITTMSNLARDLMDARKEGEAEPLLRRAVESRVRMQGPTHRSTLNTSCNLGTCLLAMGELDEAHEILDNVVRIADERSPQGTIDTATYSRALGQALVKMGRADEAKERLTRSYTQFAAALGVENKLPKGVARELAELCEQQGANEEAASWSERAKP